jgi:ubiquinone/menaquinone biosynthesis C-methylase UbiE
MRQDMKKRPPGAGKSSFELIDPQVLFRELHLKEGGNFLDLGCGRGYYSIEAAKFIGETGSIYGVDAWEEGIAVLRQKASAAGLKNVKGRVSDIGERIPLNDHCIDFCLMATVLHDLVEIKVAEKALDEVRRVLTPESILAIVEFKKIDGPPGPPISIRLSPEEVSRIVTPYGFIKKRLVEVGPYNYLMIFSF